MSGETEAEVSGWTVDTLHAHVNSMVANNDRRYEERFKGQEAAVNAALRAAQQAVDKAELATEKRFEGVNEFRAQLADQARTLMPRAETELQIKTLVDRVTAVEQTLAQGGGRSAGISTTIGVMVGLSGVVVAAIAIIVTVLTH